MEFLIYKESTTGDKLKHSIITHSDCKEELIVTITRYNYVPVTVTIKVDKVEGFSRTIERINKLVELDDEMYDMLAIHTKTD